MDRSSFSRYFRYGFIFLSALIILAGVICFILGNIKFQDKFYYSGSFIGGQLAAMSLLFIVYGMLGLYAALKREKVATIIFGSIAFVSLVTRILFWVLAAMHSYTLAAWNYGYIALEITIICFSGVIVYSS